MISVSFLEGSKKSGGNFLITIDYNLGVAKVPQVAQSIVACLEEYEHQALGCMPSEFLLKLRDQLEQLKIEWLKISIAVGETSVLHLTRPTL